MRQNAHTLTLFGVSYAALVAVSLIPLFAVGGLHDATFGIGMVIGIALIPVSAIVVTIFGGLLPRRRAVPSGVEVAARPAMPAVAREPFEFAFAAWNGIESREAVARLSKRLFALEIVHRYETGAIAVEDGAVRWAVAPVRGALRIAGWIEAEDAETRAMIRAAIEEFLIDELGIRLESLAA
ncbi:hypothetical protein ABS767_13825 [Sphingomonas sp. ST-64]|uniref:DUF2244 domain-containing protein n=1 Tax=Sphingomonas plantiphila TaxID=3163295 RepID=A0ABW8YPJ5_9SPHN